MTKRDDSMPIQGSGDQIPRARIAKATWVVGLNLLAIVGILFVLYKTRLVVGWILIALVLALALETAVQFLEHKGWRRRRALITVMVSTLVVLLILAGTMMPVLIEQGRSFVESAPSLLDKMRESKPMHWLDKHFDVIGASQKHLTENAGAATGSVLALMGGVFTALGGIVTVFVLIVFMLIFGGDVFERALGWIEPKNRKRYRKVCEDIQRVVGRYVIGSLLIASIGGTVTAVTLAIVRVPYFLPLGLAMVLLGLVPYMGPAIGAVLVVGTAFVTAGKTAGIVTAIVFVIYQQTENHLLQPLIQGKTIKMNALLIVIVMLIGTALSGVVGALLSLPIAAAAQVVLQDMKERRQASWSEAKS